MEERTVFLLGDVFYSKVLINEILENQQKIRFWLSGSEIFAFAFSDKTSVLEGLKVCLSTSGIDRKIWHLYRQLNHIPLKKHKVLENDMTGPIVCDYTFDIDSLIQYQDVSAYIEKLLETTNSV